MAPGPFLLRVCLALCAAALAWTHSDCEALSIHNLSCYYNFNQRISCEWSSERADVCTVKARKLNVYNQTFFTSYSSECTMQPTDGAGHRNCTLLFTNNIRSIDVLSLSLSCAPGVQSLVRPWCHVRLDAPGKPVANGSSLLWAPAQTSSRLPGPPEYELQWASQHNPWADGWLKSFKSHCQLQCEAELQTPPLLRGCVYRARVRVRVNLEAPGVPLGQWSAWGPTLSWESAVGESNQQPEVDGAVTLWTTGAVVGGFWVLILIVFWTTRTRWVYVMKMVKGASVPSPAPSVLKMGWKNSPFSSASFLTFLRPVDVISPAELIPVSPRGSHTPTLDHKPDLSSLSSFSNPMYSELCPTTTPLLPCSGPSLDTGESSLPDLDVLLLLSLAQQCQGVPVNCEYEKVEAVGALEGGRVRLSSMDSGVGSGEEVSQDSLHPPEDSGSLPTLEEMPERTHIMHSSI